MPSVPSWWVSTGELFEKREGSAFDSGGHRAYKRYFRVRVNTKTVDPVQVCYAPELPRPYQPYTDPVLNIVDFLAVVSRISAKPQDEDDWQVWIVTVEYDTGAIRRGAGTSGKPDAQGGDKPKDEEPEVDWDSEIETYAPQSDLDGKAIVNSAGDPFQPAPTTRVGHPCLTITRIEDSWSQDDQKKWAFRVNKDPFLGEQPGMWLMYPPKARKIYKGILKLYRVTYKVVLLNAVEVGRVSWQMYLLDCGMRQLTTVNVGTVLVPLIVVLPVPICENGHPVAHPVLLNGAGGRANRNAQGIPRPNWLRFRTIHEENFAPLQLDQYL